MKKDSTLYNKESAEFLAKMEKYWVEDNQLKHSLLLDNIEKCKKLVDIGFSNIEGLDPYTYNLYQKKTGKLCLNYSFKDIAQGRLKRKYDLVICSFALHLAEESLLPFILYNLSLITDKLIIISPSELLPTIGRGF